MCILLVYIYYCLIFYPFGKGGFFDKDTENLRTIYYDKFIGESLSLKCEFEATEKEMKVLWQTSSYYPLKKKQNSENKIDDPIRFDVINNKKSSLYFIETLLIEDSGKYECIKADNADVVFHVWFISVHDSAKMEFVLTNRGQTPYADIDKGKVQVKLLWSSWGACDGCEGRGERKRFGFCYTFWDGKKLQCNSNSIPFLLKSMAVNKKELIQVQTCYKECPYKTFILKGYQRHNLLAGKQLVLSCDTLISPRSVVRWQLDDVTLRRNDYSFRYKYNERISIETDNSLWLRNGGPESNNILKFSCIKNRTDRYNFDVATEKRTAEDESVLSWNQLYWIALTSVCQLIAFLIVFSCRQFYIALSEIWRK